MISRPLKPQYFQILLALAGGDLHGYAIQRVVLKQTEDGIHLWPTMLYRSLAKLEQFGLIGCAGPPADKPEDERRRYYTLTSEGHERLREEGEMMARWVAAARGAACPTPLSGRVPTGQRGRDRAAIP